MKTAAGFYKLLVLATEQDSVETKPLPCSREVSTRVAHVLPDQVWGKLAPELRVRGALSVHKDLLLDDVG